MPVLIIACCMLLGIIPTVSIVGLVPFAEQIGELAAVVSRMQIPSFSSVTACLIGLIVAGTLGFGIYRIEIR